MDASHNLWVVFSFLFHLLLWCTFCNLEEKVSISQILAWFHFGQKNPNNIWENCMSQWTKLLKGHRLNNLIVYCFGPSMCAVPTQYEEHVDSSFLNLTCKNIMRKLLFPGIMIYVWDSWQLLIDQLERWTEHLHRVHNFTNARSSTWNS